MTSVPTTRISHGFAAGEIYCFRTRPTNAFAPPETGRWAAFKVIGGGTDIFAVAVLDAVWEREPSLKDALRAGVLRERRFQNDGRPATFGVHHAYARGEALLDLKLLGQAPPTGAESALASSIFRLEIGTRHSSLGAVNDAAEGEFRWAYDKEAYVDEVERKQAEQRARWAAEEERTRTRLRGLTFETLLAETRFAGWSVAPPEFTAAARETIDNTCRRIRDLGPKPKRKDVRAALRDCVHWFNRADEEYGGVIETGEREDICAAIEEIAWAARQKSLAQEVDCWREF